MRVRQYALGKYYTIQCPEGTRLVRANDEPCGTEPTEQDHLIVPLNGQEVRIPAEPPELLPMLAETGNFGIVLVGEPEPEERLAGVVCPGCGQDDVTWLQLREGSKMVRCDGCGTEFGLPMPASSQVTTSRRPGG